MYLILYQRDGGNEPQASIGNNTDSHLSRMDNSSFTIAAKAKGASNVVNDL